MKRAAAAVAVEAAIRIIMAFSMISLFFEMHSLDEFVYKGPLFFIVDKIILMTQVFTLSNSSHICSITLFIPWDKYHIKTHMQNSAHQIIGMFK